MLPVYGIATINDQVECPNGAGSVCSTAEINDVSNGDDRNCGPQTLEVHLQLEKFCCISTMGFFFFFL
jgi:hypothetical protein